MSSLAPHLRVPYRSGGQEGEVWLCCPFCTSRGESEDTKFRLGVNLLTGEAHCFNCEWKGRGKWALQQISKALGQLPFAEKKTAAQPVVDNLWKKDYIRVTHANSDEFEKATVDYLLNRGIWFSTLRRHGVGYAITGPGAYRVWFPVLNKEKHWVGAVTRAWQKSLDQGPKYLIIPRGLVKPLYGEWKIRKGVDRAVVVEGVVDALRVEQASGIPTLALLGSSASEEQLETLSTIKHLLLALDRDSAGVRGMAKLAAALAGRVAVSLAQPCAKDWGEMDDQEIRVCLKECRPYSPWGLISLGVRAAQPLS